MPNATGGCDPPNPTASANCLKFTIPLASWSGGIPPAGTQTNTDHLDQHFDPDFQEFHRQRHVARHSASVTAFRAGGRGRGAADTDHPQAAGGRAPTSSTGSSREFNKANIRILLASTEADLVPDRPALIGDLDNVNLDNGCAGGRTDTVTGVGVTPWAMANTGTGFEGNWPGVPTGAVHPTGACTPTAGNPWPLIDGWLRVEYLNAAGNWIGVTRAWLQLGFARGLNIPNTLGGNGVHPNAILIFQELADRNASGTLTGADAPSDITVVNGNSKYSWYPINFYDPREGFPRDTNPGLVGTQCYVNGIMNAVELDVGNLNRWVLGAIGAGGPLVSYSSQNGYLVFFSDRRGMLPDPNQRQHHHRENTASRT